MSACLGSDRKVTLNGAALPSCNPALRACRAASARLGDPGVLCRRHSQRYAGAREAVSAPGAMARCLAVVAACCRGIQDSNLPGGRVPCHYAIHLQGAQRHDEQAHAHPIMHWQCASRVLYQVPARQPTHWRASARVGCGRLVYSAGAADPKRQPAGCQVSTHAVRQLVRQLESEACPQPSRHAVLSSLSGCLPHAAAACRWNGEARQTPCQRCAASTSPTAAWLAACRHGAVA